MVLKPTLTCVTVLRDWERDKHINVLVHYLKSSAYILSQNRAFALQQYRHTNKQYIKNQ